MSKRRFIEFDKSFLKKLTVDPDSLVTVHRSDYHFALHPWHLNNFNQSVKDCLNTEISQYNSNLDGIVLGYKNLALAELGQIHADSHFIHCDAQADFFIFKPQINKCLNGTVIKKSRDHISCRVYDCFTVSIPRPNTEGDWIGDDMDVGDVVKINIEYINYQGPHIKGKILHKEHSSESTNQIITEDNVALDKSLTTPKKKSKKDKSRAAVQNIVSDGKDKSSVVNTDWNTKPEKQVKHKEKQKQQSLVANESINEPEPCLTTLYDEQFSRSGEDQTNTDDQISKKSKRKSHENITPNILGNKQEPLVSSLTNKNHNIKKVAIKAEKDSEFSIDKPHTQQCENPETESSMLNTEWTSFEKHINHKKKQKQTSLVANESVNEPQPCSTTLYDEQFSQSDEDQTNADEDISKKSKRKSHENIKHNILGKKQEPLFSPGINKNHNIKKVAIKIKTEKDPGSSFDKFNTQHYENSQIESSILGTEWTSFEKEMKHKKQKLKPLVVNESLNDEPVSQSEEDPTNVCKGITKKIKRSSKSDHSMEQLVIKAEKDQDGLVKKRKLKDTSLDESNSDTFSPKKKRKKTSSLSLEATKDELVNSILKEKCEQIEQDYTNATLKPEEIMLPDLDMKSIMESINSKPNISGRSGTLFNNTSLDMSDSSLDAIVNSPIKCEPGS